MTKLSAGWSRRTFLRGALVTGAIALPASGVLVGCGTSSSGQQAAEVANAALDVSTATTDIYMLNGGFGSIWIPAAHTTLRARPTPV
jgi:hypothetical protein